MSGKTHEPPTSKNKVLREDIEMLYLLDPEAEYVIPSLKKNFSLPILDFIFPLSSKNMFNP